MWFTQNIKATTQNYKAKKLILSLRHFLQSKTKRNSFIPKHFLGIDRIFQSYLLFLRLHSCMCAVIKIMEFFYTTLTLISHFCENFLIFKR